MTEDSSPLPSDSLGVTRVREGSSAEREELVSQLEQQRITARLGEFALRDDSTLDELFTEAVECVSEALDAEYCKVLDLLPSGGSLHLRAGTGWRDGIVGSATVGTDLESQAGYTLLSDGPVVVPDYREEIRFSRPELLTSHNVTSGISAIVGSSDDPWGILAVHDSERREFSRFDIDFVQSVANLLATAIERQENQEMLAAREETLREAYTVISDPDRPFSEKLDALLPIARKQVGTEVAALSQVRPTTNDYLIEAIDASEDVDVFDAGEVVDLSKAVNCERIAETTDTLVTANIEEEAPDRIDRNWGVSCYLGVPLLLDGEVYGTLCFYGRAPRHGGFSEWEVTFVELLSTWVSAELQRLEDMDEITALNELNSVVREINEAIVQQSTREEIEQVVCEKLAASTSYEFAWTGKLSQRGSTVEPEAVAGAETYLDGLTITVGTDEKTSNGPTGQAFATGEVQVLQELPTAPEHEPWRDQTDAHDVNASAAIPIVYEDAVYGVLNVYTARQHAFTGAEKDVISQLGQIIGHAINSIERKQALSSNETTQLEFVISDMLAEFGVEPPSSGHITLDGAVEIDAGTFQLFGSAIEGAVETIDELAAALPHFGTLQRITEGEERIEFVIRLDEPPVLSEVAKHGGQVNAAIIEDGDLRMTIEVPPAVDVRRIKEVVQGTYPDATVQAQRTMTRATPTRENVRETFLNEFTAKQRTALKLSHKGGFFDWPRDSTGEEIAELMGVSAPTFHQHLRHGQKRLVGALFEDIAPTETE